MKLEIVLSVCCYWQRVKIVNTSLNPSEKIYEGSVQDFFPGIEHEYIDYKYLDYKIGKIAAENNTLLLLIDEGD